MVDDDGTRNEAQDAVAAGQDTGDDAVRDRVNGEVASDAEAAAKASAADETGEDVLAWVTGMVGERPMLALLGAAAAGYALALLLHGGRR